MIKIIKSKLFRFVKSKKINVFILFLALSFMFLLLTKLTQDYTKTLNFNIEPINAKENYVIISDSTHNFDVTLSTYGFKLLRFYLSKPKLTVDLSELDNYGNNYVWTKSRGIAHISSQFNENVKLLALNPDTIRFKFDVNAVKQVPVNLQTDISFVPGFDISGEYNVIPDSVKIIGPKVLLDSIKSVKTELLSLSDIKFNIDQSLGVILPDSSENLVYSHKKVIIKGKVEKFTEGSIEVPVDVVNVPDNVAINYFPKSINVLYYTSLSNFKNVNKSDFIVECDFNDLTTESVFLEPKIVKSPNNIKSTKLSRKRIEFIISE